MYVSPKAFSKWLPLVVFKATLSKKDGHKQNYFTTQQLYNNVFCYTLMPLTLWSTLSPRAGLVMVDDGEATKPISHLYHASSVHFQRKIKSLLLFMHKTGEAYMWHDQGECVGCRRYGFWDIGKERGQIMLLYIVFSVDKLIITWLPDNWLWGLNQNVAFSSCQKGELKTQIWKSSTCDSFLLIMSHIRIFKSIK